VLQDRRQIGFIAGEPGIGKTALVDTFVAQVAASTAVRVAHGQCIEHYGVGEAYLPVLEALGRLGRDADRVPLCALLRRYASSWLMHLPGLLSPAERRRLAQTGVTVTPARTLRELAEALEVLTVERPLVLVLEDLHWSDSATLDWLAYLARRPDPARLLVLGTYRPVELRTPAHPLRRMLTELHHHTQCAEVVLDYLSEVAVASYLQQRFDAKPLPAGLARVLHRHTTGNPLFLVAVVDELVRQQVLQEGPGAWQLPGGIDTVSGLIPASVRGLIARHIDRLPAQDQVLLEAASVAGSTFAIAAVAAAVAMPEEAVEARCAVWMHQEQLLHAAGTETWPDGTVTACYRFRHALYQNAVYERITTGQRLRLHRSIAARLEHGYGAHASDVATELAMHFERGRDFPRAVRYLQQAGQRSMERSAYVEAVAHLSRGLEVLKTLAATPERHRQELTLHIALGAALLATRGHAAPEVEHTYTQAYALCQQVGETPQFAQVLFGLWRFYVGQAQLHRAREIGDTLLHLAQQAHDPALAVVAHYALGVAWFFLGVLPTARLHLEEGSACYTPDQSRALVFRIGQDPGVGCQAYGAMILWLLGYPDQALARLAAALTLAHELSQPFSLAWAWSWAAMISQLRRDVPAVRKHADASVTLSSEQEFPFWASQGMVFRGWALAMQGQSEEGLAQVRQGLTAYRATGAAVFFPYLCTWAAEVYDHLGHTADGLQALAEAHILIGQHEERWWEAEVARLRGVLLLRQTGAQQEEAETWLQRALDVARRQEAKWLELRTAISLARLWQQQGRRVEAYELLAPVYNWFAEGFDIADFQEARTLLDALGA
jgi:predicted ATPase